MNLKKTILSALTLLLVGGGVAVASPAQAGANGQVFNASQGQTLRVQASGGSRASNIYDLPPSTSSRNYAPNALGFSVPQGTCAQVIVNGNGPAKLVGSGFYTVYGSDAVWVKRVGC